MLDGDTPFVLFRDDLAARDRLFAAPARIIIAEGEPTFFASLDELEQARTGGKWLAGYFAYEAGYLFEPKLRPLLPAQRSAPLLAFGVFDAPEDSHAPRARSQPSNGPIFEARATWSFADYERRFRRVHQHLRQGDCYQTNLTFPIEAGWSGAPLAAFAALVERQPVRYGALVALGEPLVLSRSPELFFEVSADGFIETRPMKGTAPRGATPAEDERLRDFLANDPKNQAENRMIVDLLRNDVSRISEVGTLDVPELFRVESYPTVHQMVSTVRARLRPSLAISEIFAALFPCGSITGAPKIRAMEIIRALENAPRGAYCGAIGWIAPDGTMRFNVAIRTISLFSGGRAVYNVGGGVVFDSEVEAEYRECLLKARFATGLEPISS
jgi:para-aminobenzoate synthetase component I